MRRDGGGRKVRRFGDAIYGLQYTDADGVTRYWNDFLRSYQTRPPAVGAAAGVAIAPAPQREEGGAAFAFSAGDAEGEGAGGAHLPKNFHNALEEALRARKECEVLRGDSGFEYARIRLVSVVSAIGAGSRGGPDERLTEHLAERVADLIACALKAAGTPGRKES